MGELLVMSNFSCSYNFLPFPSDEILGQCKLKTYAEDYNVKCNLKHDLFSFIALTAFFLLPQFFSKLSIMDEPPPPPQKKKKKKENCQTKTLTMSDKDIFSPQVALNREK